MKKKLAVAFMIASLCSGLFSTPVSFVHAQADGANNNAAVVSAAAEDSSAYERRLEPCLEAPFSINIGGCLSRFLYFTTWVSAHFARLTGEIFDYFLAYSIDSGSYQGTNNDFVEKGWGVVRDIANVAFIFMLLFMAISHILQIGGDIKKGIRNLIIAALLINFSLFFTKVIIDAGNILARAFYHNIEIVNEENPDHKSISAGIADKLEPQKLVSSELFNPVAAPGREAQYIDSGWASLILALATFVNITLGLAFLSVFLLFAARVIGLWFMIIFSPVAFLTVGVPSIGGFFKGMSFSGWLNQTMSLSFMAPIFMFFLFLLVMFLEVVYGTTIPGDQQSSMQKIMAVVVPFIAVVIIIRFAKDQAKTMSGKFGEALVGAVGKIAGYGLGAAGLVAGGTAVLGRAVVGRAATAAKDSTWFKEKAANNRFYRQLYKGTVAASQGSMDVRNSTGFKKAAGFVGQGLAGTGVSLKPAFAGEGTKKGGYAQRLEAYQKEKEEFKKNLKVEGTAKQAEVEYQIERRDDKGNITRDAKGKPIIVKRTAKDISLQEAEINLLTAQNNAKAKEDDHTIVIGKDADGKDLTKVVSQKDYEGLVKEKESAKEKQKQAEIDLASAQRAATRNPDGSIVKDEAYLAAEKALSEAKGLQKGLTDYIKDFEKRNWGEQEAIFKALEKQTLKTDADMLRNYAKSVNKGGLTTLYEMAKANSGVAGNARERASGNMALEAEKLGKKADDKK